MYADEKPWHLRAAAHSDLAKVISLLGESDLPTEDVEDHLQWFLLAFRGETLAGSVGMESYGTVALFRSLAVSEDDRGQGLGKLLAKEILKLAAEQGVKAVYLLTTTAADFFPRLGFEVIPRNQAPAAIAGTTSFRELCPGSATLMRLSLEAR